MTDVPIQIETGSAPDFALIWLHGLGADGSDFVPVIPELGLSPARPGRFIFPHAPYRPVTCNGGYEMRAWYDILSLAPGHREVDQPSLLQAREQVRQLIAAQVGAGIPSQRIFLAGFSQGGAVAYSAALTHPEPLGGVIALSTYLPWPEWVQAEASEANRALPVFAAHGSDDDVVAPALGLQARQWLEAQGYRPAWQVYPMEHAVCREEVADIGAWLSACLDR